jgi:tetratricopeptide (TPR) repeat protein
MKRRPQSRRATLRELPFDELVVSDPELSQARRHYAEQPPPVRREAADWAYHSRIADSLFADALQRKTAGPEPVTRFEPGVVALAIDPLFAPALLTVGSLEYQLGRHNAAMQMFLAMAALPAQEPDLVEIVEKAATLLLDAGDVDHTRQLYQQAADHHPGMATYWSGIGYCLARCGQRIEAVNAIRRAVALEPDNPVLLNDLGWTLVEAGQYAEARSVLQRAEALADPGFDLPRQNLSELETRSPRPPHPRQL